MSTNMNTIFVVIVPVLVIVFLICLVLDFVIVIAVLGCVLLLGFGLL